VELGEVAARPSRPGAPQPVRPVEQSSKSLIQARDQPGWERCDQSLPPPAASCGEQRSPLAIDERFDGTIHADHAIISIVAEHLITRCQGSQRVCVLAKAAVRCQRVRVVTDIHSNTGSSNASTIADTRTHHGSPLSSREPWLRAIGKPARAIVRV